MVIKLRLFNPYIFQVKEACRKAFATEQLAKDRLCQMNDELNIHCRITVMFIVVPKLVPLFQQVVYFSWVMIYTLKPVPHKFYTISSVTHFSSLFYAPHFSSHTMVDLTIHQKNGWFNFYEIAVHKMWKQSFLISACLYRACSDQGLNLQIMLKKKSFNQADKCLFASYTSHPLATETCWIETGG